MRSTGTGSGDCCVAFDNGVCSNDLTCTETYIHEQNNYTCGKSDSVSKLIIGPEQGFIKLTAPMHVFSLYSLWSCL